MGSELNYTFAPGRPEFWGLLVLAGGTGYASMASAPVRLAMSYYRSPALTFLSRNAASSMWRTTASSIMAASRAYRYLGYLAFAQSPFATYHYLREGEYEKAMIQYFGPIGSVYIYNKFTGSQKSTVKPEPPRRSRPSRKPSEIPKNQKMRLWRMGLRWCRQHGRYDRCSLRARR
jgi:hypothetical protein